MITEFMTLNTASDADQWASDLGLETDEQVSNVSNYIWNNKPAISCTYAQFKEANPEFEDDKTFWKIADGE